MRLGEECPYITPCGWCSRLNKPCEMKQRKKKTESCDTCAHGGTPYFKPPCSECRGKSKYEKREK